MWIIWSWVIKNTCGIWWSILQVSVHYWVPDVHEALAAVCAVPACACCRCIAHHLFSQPCSIASWLTLWSCILIFYFPAESCNALKWRHLYSVSHYHHFSLLESIVFLVGCKCWFFFPLLQFAKLCDRKSVAKYHFMISICSSTMVFMA